MPGSKATLALLSQVDAIIENIHLSNGSLSVPYSNLQKHHDAIELAAKQQLHSLDLGLQTYKLALECLDQLDKLLEHPRAAKAGKLLNNLHILEVCFFLCFSSINNLISLGF